MINATQAMSTDAISPAARRPLKRLSKYLAMAAFALGTHAAHAAVFTEDFNAPFPAWESGFFGVNSNAVNSICLARGCTDRGSSTDGLYVTGPGQTAAIDVSFNTGFAGTITAFAFDVAAVLDTTLLAFDSSGNQIFSQAVAASASGIPTAADYTRVVINSVNGISRFAFTDDSPANPFGGPPAGFTLIDNLLLTTRDPVVTPPGAVPEPGSIALLGMGLLGCLVMRRKSAGRNS